MHKSRTAVCLQSINAVTYTRTLNDNGKPVEISPARSAWHHQTLLSVSKVPDKTEWSWSPVDSHLEVMIHVQFKTHWPCFLLKSCSLIWDCMWSRHAVSSYLQTTHMVNVGFFVKTINCLKTLHVSNVKKTFHLNLFLVVTKSGSMLTSQILPNWPYFYKQTCHTACCIVISDEWILSHPAH